MKAKSVLKKNGTCTFCGTKLDSKAICNKSGCWYAGKSQWVQVLENE